MGRVVFVALAVVMLVLSDPAIAYVTAPPIRVPISTASADKVVTVVSGDHLWKISDRHLTSVLGRDALDREVSPYWRQVIDVNRHTIRSGDPNLIFPGELITLPPFP